ncbi:MAG TPA: pirin family protein [Chloroflexota bacterium]|nr:pirin family protein [Chloroflexota bacterium]
MIDATDTSSAGSAGASTQAARPAAAVASSVRVMEGAGVPIRRVLPSREFPYQLVDPFLLLDHFHMDSFDGGAFPPHPHRGFEIVTYMLQGEGHHSDSEGNRGTVRAGGLQRITAGRGIWHGEGGEGPSSGPVEGLQLWINLERAAKGIPPGYQAVQAEEIPERTIDDARVRVLLGEGSPTRLHTPSVYYDVYLPPQGKTTVALAPEFQGFAYLLEGDGAFGSNQVAATTGQIVVLGQGGPFTAVAGGRGAHFVLAAGKPHREPVRFNGPYVD